MGIFKEILDVFDLGGYDTPTHQFDEENFRTQDYGRSEDLIQSHLDRLSGQQSMLDKELGKSFEDNRALIDKISGDNRSMTDAKLSRDYNKNLLDSASLAGALGTGAQQGLLARDLLRSHQDKAQDLAQGAVAAQIAEDRSREQSLLAALASNQNLVASQRGLAAQDQAGYADRLLRLRGEQTNNLINLERLRAGEHARVEGSNARQADIERALIAEGIKGAAGIYNPKPKETK